MTNNSLRELIFTKCVNKFYIRYIIISLFLKKELVIIKATIQHGPIRWTAIIIITCVKPLKASWLSQFNKARAQAY